MKLTRQQIDEARQVYDLYWDSYVKGDVDTFAGTLDENFEMIGTSESEICHSKEEGIEFVKSQVDELIGIVEMRNRQIKTAPLENFVLVNEHCDIYTLAEGDWSFYSKIRISTLLRETPEGWKVVQQHGSFPDLRVQEGETLAIDKIHRENLELRDAVKRRTAELENKKRELEIEAAMERIRVQSMAMQQPDDLNKVNQELLNQLNSLQVEGLTGVSIWLIDNDGIVTAWDLSSPGNMGDPSSATVHYDAEKYDILGEPWRIIQKSDDDYFVLDYPVKKLQKAIEEWDKVDPAVATNFREALTTGKLTHQWNPMARHSHGLLSIDLVNPPPADTREIVTKMAGAFSLAYRRFLDLQKAEAQAREAQIEAALERVRSSTMGMQHSEDLSNVASVMFDQMNGLGGELFAFGIVLCDKQKDTVEQWHNLGNEGMITPFTVPIDLDYIHRYRYDQWRAGKELFSIEIPEDYIEEHFELMFELPSVKSAMDEVAARGVQVEIPDWEIDYCASFTHGYLLVSSLKEFEEDHIFPKFAKAFDQAYTRYLDLQKAEVQTREAQIEASLERARAQSMMMQHSDEINFISNAFHEQLILLGIPSEFSYVWLPDEENQSHQFWASWSEMSKGEIRLQSKQVTYPLDKSEPYTAACFEAWSTPDVVLEEFIPPEEIAGFFDVWQELLSGAEKLKAEHFPEGIYYSEAYMRYGCFGINIRRKLSDEEKSILKRFSKEFERAYTRFLDLQKAEEQARLIREERDRLEIALNKLHATQEQLIQQEKLASLGQLTAGIAHEIKNPLNFVNNFSDVSIELVEEAREEVLAQKQTLRKETDQNPLLRGESSTEGDARGVLEKASTDGQTQDPEIESSSTNTPLNPLSRGEAGSIPQMDLILEILDDIEGNLRKIHEHGSRADSIVKSMLQHSRGGDGKMEPTPLNPLIKEYVNLAFHGMRAGNDPINVDIDLDLDLDENVGEVSLIAEDFSRVILNLCNNAFDALKEKLTSRQQSGRQLSAESGNGYKPKLTIRTLAEPNTVTISIEDNGPGIPDEIKDKIMQPFFTTKKGTQGTGLGLSITNDIVKAHGGIMNIDSQPGQTIFTIKFNR
ncbi:ATP-binding protein [Rhodohalobacter mucosus]|uniref:histidine kinase n=1 Tax=Rhodohalobacter mucosus TaxID=2079485 RepID=A0A316TMF0_9BACT|nr:ATP-binding protein [Rhodohalobacter mucosus]PWN05773.1 hypothetical protein DDZ15_11280 [Rhodohalobacter mucosus]